MTENDVAPKVLIVDDEENILKAIARLTMDEDFETVTATSGEEGLKRLMEICDVAVILSDQRMPGMSGAEFLEQARTIAPDALRMVLTGYADINAAMDAINKGGASRYLSKPWDDSLLVQTLRDGVAYYRIVRENQRLQEVIRQKNEELQEWNHNLKTRVLEQTAMIRKKNEELSMRNARIEGSFHRAIQVFGRLSELRGGRSQTHAKTVETLSVNVAREMGLPSEQVDLIRLAAQVHDIGEIGISEELLGKSLRNMDQEAQEIYLRHAVRGQAVIDAIEDLRPVGVLVRHHHEHYNGTGRPDGLAGEAIPLGSRIIAFADFIDREMGDQRGEDAVTMLLRAISFQVGVTLDPALSGHFKRAVRYHYFSKVVRQTEAEEAEYHPRELVSGMAVTRDVYSGTGLLLLGKGTPLDDQKIDSLRRYYNIDPPLTGVFAIRGS